MEEHNIPHPIGANLSSTISDTSRIIEEGPRVCPLCNSIIRLFHINLKEQVYLCENVECVFPFGYEDVLFIKSNFQEDIFSEEDSDKYTDITSRYRSSATESCVSTASWAEIDKINKACESEDSVFDNKAPAAFIGRDKNIEMLRKEREAEKKLQKRVNNIRSLNIELNKTEEKGQSLDNEKFIKKLMHLQEISGCKLLKEEEMIKVKKQEPQLGLGELKIDIRESADSMSTITIAISTPQSLSDGINPLHATGAKNE